MDEKRARSVVDGLRESGVPAEVEHAGVYQFGIRVDLRDGRVAVWDTDGSAALEAQVMQDGVLVGFVPTLPGSEDFDEGAVIAAIAGTDYDEPVATRRSGPPPAADPLPPQGGVFRRFLDGFR